MRRCKKKKEKSWKGLAFFGRDCYKHHIKRIFEGRCFGSVFIPKYEVLCGKSKELFCLRRRPSCRTEHARHKGDGAAGVLRCYAPFHTSAANPLLFCRPAVRSRVKKRPLKCGAGRPVQADVHRKKRGRLFFVSLQLQYIHRRSDSGRWNADWSCLKPAEQATPCRSRLRSSFDPCFQGVPESWKKRQLSSLWAATL